MRKRHGQPERAAHERNHEKEIKEQGRSAGQERSRTVRITLRKLNEVSLNVCKAPRPGAKLHRKPKTKGWTDGRLKPIRSKRLAMRLFRTSVLTEGRWVFYLHLISRTKHERLWSLTRCRRTDLPNNLIEVPPVTLQGFMLEMDYKNKKIKKISQMKNTWKFQIKKIKKNLNFLSWII